MQVARLKAEPRSALGRNQLRQLRSEGWMPAVVYGDGKEAESIAISEWELDQHMKHHHRVFQLEIGAAKQAAYLQDIKFDSLNDRIQHADFKRIDLTKPIEVEVEVGFTGHPKGVGKGGVLIKDHGKIKIRCLPTSIPEELPLAIGNLDLEEMLLAKDVPLPAGVTLAVADDLVVCHVAKLVVQAAAPAAEAAPAEGAAAPAAGAPAAAAPAKDAPKKDAGKK